MPRPIEVNVEKIAEYDEMIDNDPNFPEGMQNNKLVREVCYAGLYMCEQLEALGCPEALMVRIQYTAGKQSFGSDPWEVHQEMLAQYKNNELKFDLEPDEVN